MVWFIFLGWVGFGFETPTANTDVTLPSLIIFFNNNFNYNSILPIIGLVFFSARLRLEA